MHSVHTAHNALIHAVTTGRHALEVDGELAEDKRALGEACVHAGEKVQQHVLGSELVARKHRNQHLAQMSPGRRRRGSDRSED